MEVESVSYVYSLAEVEALLEILGCPGIAFCERRPEIALRGRESLERGLLVSGSEAGLAVDKIAAFLVKTVSETDRYTCLFGGAYYRGLFYTAYGSVLLCRNRESWVFTPFQKFRDARGAFLEEYSPADGQVLAVKNTLGRWTRQLRAEDDWPYILRLAAECILIDSVPRERSGQEWRQ